jgi:hypothetical protein
MVAKGLLRLRRPFYLSRVDHVRKIRDRKQRTDIGKYSFVNKSKGGPVWPRGFQEVYTPIFHDIRHMEVVRSASRTSRLHPQEMCLILIFARS